MTKPQLMGAVLAVVAVLVFDAVAAAVEKGGGAYRWFGILEIFLYLAIGFMAARATGTWRGGLGVVVIAAIAEVSLGFYVHTLIGPSPVPAGTSFAKLASLGLIAILWNGIVGLVGALIGMRFARKATPA
jgi:hypothetical protein